MRRRCSTRSTGPVRPTSSPRPSTSWPRGSTPSGVASAAAPKFPQPSLVDLALRQALRLAGTDEGDRAARLATRTLDAMAAGGIHDHLGGGFARYATDTEWLVPHFEKMLYDQAGLLRAYLHGWQVTGDPAYLAVAEGIVAYVTRDLTAPEGGVYSAEDADSEGVEGKFYVWTPGRGAEAAVAAGPDARTVAEAVLGVVRRDRRGQLRGDHHPAAPGRGPARRSRPRRGGPASPAGRAGRPGCGPGSTTRSSPSGTPCTRRPWPRPPPPPGAPTGPTAAVGIGRFLVRPPGRRPRAAGCAAGSATGGARHLAYAADHAWLVDCFTRLAELTGEAVWTERATATADALIARFADVDGGGFFTTADDAEQLIVRTKDVFDGATPSANAVAALALARLGALTGDATYTDHARRVVDLIGDLLIRHPTAFAHTVLTADLLARGATEVVVTGDRPDLLAEVRRHWLPDAVVAWGEPTDSPLWADRAPGFAYVCRGYRCQVPAADVADLADQLTGSRPRATSRATC